MTKLGDTFWIELLDLCWKHGVTELRSKHPNVPARVILSYDARAGSGEFIVADVEVVAKQPAPLQLQGTTTMHVFAHNVHVVIDETYSPSGLLKYVHGMLRQWRTSIPVSSRPTGRSS